MSTQVANVNGSGDVSAATMEGVLIEGDLSKLNPKQRVEYYRAVCKSQGLNPLTKPFDYLKLNGKLVLYAKRECTEQLRKLHGVSVVELTQDIKEGVLLVTCKVRDREGKEDIDMGAVPIAGLKGDALGNAMKKAVTQAKRRATLSICGLGWLDETETTQIPDAKPVAVDEETGEIVDHDEKPAARPAASSGSMISEAQRKRLWAITCDAVGRDDAETTLRAVCEHFGFDSSKDITKDAYEDVCEAVKEYADQPQTSTEVPE